jgi:hypothetical protein
MHGIETTCIQPISLSLSLAIAPTISSSFSLTAYDGAAPRSGSSTRVNNILVFMPSSSNNICNS